MIQVTVNTVHSDSTYCYMSAIDSDGDLYLGRVYVQTTLTLALREYNLPNAVSPYGWDEHTPCWQVQP